MDPKLAFWTAALVDLLAIVVLSAVGIRGIRRHRVALHRRCMKTSAWLVVGFLAAYAIKINLLGKESLASWSDAAVLNLRIHETFVLVMVTAGSLALLRARRMRDTRNVSRSPDDPPAAAAMLRSHRRAGWTAAVAAGLGFATAALVLAGMYRRVGV